MKTSVAGTHYPGGTILVFLPPLKMTPRNSMSSREWEIENWWSKTSFQNNLLTWIFYKPIVLLLSEFTSNRRTAAWGLEGITPVSPAKTVTVFKKKSILITKMHLSVKEKQTHRYREHTCGAQGEVGGGGRVDWEFGISRCKLLHKGWMNNKVLLYNTGNYIQ